MLSWNEADRHADDQEEPQRTIALPRYRDKNRDKNRDRPLPHWHHFLFPPQMHLAIEQELFI